MWFVKDFVHSSSSWNSARQNYEIRNGTKKERGEEKERAVHYGTQERAMPIRFLGRVGELCWAALPTSPPALLLVEEYRGGAQGVILTYILLCAGQELLLLHTHTHTHTHSELHGRQLVTSSPPLSPRAHFSWICFRSAPPLLRLLKSSRYTSMTSARYPSDA